MKFKINDKIMVSEEYGKDKKFRFFIVTNIIKETGINNYELLSQKGNIKTYPCDQIDLICEIYLEPNEILKRLL